MSAPLPRASLNPSRTSLINAGLIVLAVAALALSAVRQPEADATIELTRGDPPPGVDELTVHLTGAVAFPGLVIAEPGESVAELIARSGGTLPGARLEGVNLALRPRAGDTVHVPFEGEPSGLLLDLNAASRAELEQLPGIGPARASAIIGARPLIDPRELLDQGLVPASVWEEIRMVVTTH